MVADDVTRQLLASYEAGELVVVCALCRRVELDGRWQRAARPAFTALAEFALTHGVCPSCNAEISGDD